MTDNSHDHYSVRPISWEDFHGLCKGLAQAVFPFRPEIILAIGRGGYYPGTLIAHILQADMYPVQVSRRVNDVITYQTPRWLVEPPSAVKGRCILVVDEICCTGDTLSMVKQKVEALGAKETRTAVLYAHAQGTSVPDYIGLISDALLLNPWDREILREGGFQLHPEYAEELARQGLTPDASLLIKATVFQVGKG